MHSYDAQGKSVTDCVVFCDQSICLFAVLRVYESSWIHLQIISSFLFRLGCSCNSSVFIVKKPCVLTCKSSWALLVNECPCDPMPLRFACSRWCLTASEETRLPSSSQDLQHWSTLLRWSHMKARWRWVLEFQCQSDVCVRQGEIRWLILPQHRGALLVLRLTASLTLPFCLPMRLVPAADPACSRTWQPSDRSSMRCWAWRWDWACLQYQERSFPWSL